MPDAMEAAGEDMNEEAADELVGGRVITFAFRVPWPGSLST